MENSSIPTGEDHRPPTDLGSASLHPSLTAQTGGNTVDHSEQKATDLRSVPCHSSVTAQTAGNTVLPHISGCHVGGSFHLNVNIQSDTKGVEDRGNGRLMKLLQDVSLGAGATGSDDITGSKSGAVCSRPVTSGAEREPTDHHESCAGPELGGTQIDSQSQQLKRKIDEAIISDKKTLKSDLKKKFKHIFESLAKRGHRTLLNEIYTELYITEGGNGGVNNEHEIGWIEKASKRQTTQETAILCNDIFTSSPGHVDTIRIVLTKGIAGIGKTVSVQKFILDWAEGKANQDIDFIFTLPFRDLNLMEGETFSLMQLLQNYFPKLTFQDHFSQKEITSFDCKLKVLFIFDGLDECRLSLDFLKNKIFCDATKTTTVEKLLTNLILGNLLPSALLWITSRPAAANQIPDECIDRVTEVRGFNDPQKEEYFMKRFNNQNLADRVISHIKSSKSLYILCHIPVICWISAIVLETVFGGTGTKVIPKTLTEMYTHFLLIQTNMKNKKYHGTNETNSKNMPASDIEILLKLGQLAFLQLDEGNLIFYEKDLRESGIDVSDASVYSGVCTEIFKQESGFYREKVYCFVHLSIQEYLAALFVFHSFVNGNKNLLCMEDQEEDQEDTETSEEEYRRMPLSDLHKSAVEEALQSENGHLDLFLRFLLGLSLESTQDLLQDLLAKAGSSSLVIDILRNRQKRRNHVRHQTLSRSRSHVSETRSTLLGIKKRFNTFLDRIRHRSATKTHNLFHIPQIRSSVRDSQRKTGSSSLLRDFQRKTGSSSLVRDSQRKTGSSSLLRDSQRKTGSSSLVPDSQRKTGSSSLVPDSQRKTGSSSLVGDSQRKARSRSQSREETVQYIKGKIREESTAERTLNLFHCLNELNDNSLVEEIQISLKSGKLSHVPLEPGQCSALAFVLLMSEEVLDVFDLKTYNTSVAGQLRLLTIIKNCRRALLSTCNLTENSCEIVASALQSDSSPLVELDFSNNDLGDSGVELLCAGLRNPNCKLQILRLSVCNITEKSSKIVASALQSDSSPLVELDLSNNDLGDSGVELLCAGLRNPNCKLQILRLSGCQVTKRGCASLASALHSNPSHLIELDLSYNHPGESGVSVLSAGVEDPGCRLEKVNVAHGGQIRLKPGMRKYACKLTLEPCTAHKSLSLSERNRKATRSEGKEESYPDHPERFDSYHQVLCREGLAARCYWEVELSGKDYKTSEGWTAVGVAYKGICRKGFADTSFLGGSDRSWSLELNHFQHFSNYGGIHSPTIVSALASSRVGVYLDWLAGSLSFYRISSDMLTHLHTFHTTFTEPVYPGFGVCPDSSVSLCMLG